LNHPLLAGRAFIAETPIDKPGDDRRNVAALWRLAGREIVVIGEDEPKPRKKTTKPAKAKAGSASKSKSKPRRVKAGK
jgi:hypothetical protein